MGTLVLAPKHLTPAKLPYKEADLLEAQDLADSILTYSKQREAQTAWDSRFNAHNPCCPPSEAVQHVLETVEEIEGILQTLVLRELKRRGEIDLCLAAYDWFISDDSSEMPIIPQFYDAAISACGHHFSRYKKALSILQDCDSIGVKPSAFTYNMAISACSHSGNWEKAFETFEKALSVGVRPNSFTFDVLIQACNFKHAAQWERAMYAMKKFQETDGFIPETVVQALLNIARVAMKKATRWQNAMAVFVGLQKLGLECNASIFDSLLKACGKDRACEKAMDVFNHMMRLGVGATTDTYNALISACYKAGRHDLVLEVFEWMVEGRGANEPIAADVGTFNLLLQSCHEGGMLEKAFEVVAWMEGSGVEFDPSTYEELLGTLEVAEMWDRKGQKMACGLGTSWKGISKDFKPRPAPFDGMRMLYLEEEDERFVEELLSREKLGTDSWAPSTMRPAVSKASREFERMDQVVMGGEEYYRVPIGAAPRARTTTLPRLETSASRAVASTTMPLRKHYKGVQPQYATS